jgi:tetratricopeptide (TPR) repeat protein
MQRGALAFTQGRKALATELFEQALAIDYDHPETIVGLSKILLEVDDMDSPPESSRRAIKGSDEVSAPEGEAYLDKMASQNRALGLLEKLVASARGWDLPDAWYLLADALDKSGETELAKSALWRVVELEDGTGVRKWRSCGIGVV